MNPDQELAARLTGFLETSGFPVFVDSKIRLGQDWVEQIDVELRRSQFFVALLSAASVESDMVQREIALAYKLKKAKSLIIFPVRLGFEGELPYEIGAYLDPIQYIVWRPGEPFERICESVVSALRGSDFAVAAPRPAPAHTTS